MKGDTASTESRQGIGDDFEGPGYCFFNDDRFCTPTLAVAGDFLVVICEEHYMVNKSRINGSMIMMKYVEYNASTWMQELLRDNGGAWGTSIPFNHLTKANYTFAVGPAAVSAEKNLYLFYGAYQKTQKPWTQPRDRSYWDPFVTVAVTERPDGLKGLWLTNSVNLKSRIEDQLDGGNLIQLIGGGGAGIMYAPGIPVYPMQATNKNGKVVSLIMHSVQHRFNWSLSEGTSDEGCTTPTVVD
ncbi:trans-sialidase [Trypanosoma rangeli]|uniref:Trans-sialidase n=1 Tax=Trypanosoma rangeli TaxID=5698 RepID=A0A3R7M7Y9_TRYRA|nr:trans-sialidase [Trypanosoma rangeli]RNF01082.1 trans-sialidase [Trypanosoma rangeli]|eukprot:RNF01082.1 trans-sialidase [Trypanosoma rangeli]